LLTTAFWCSASMLSVRRHRESLISKPT